MSGLGFGGLSISESESARNFMDKCVDEKKSATKHFFREKNKFLISRMDLPPAGRGIQYFTFLIKNDQIRTKFSKKCQNDTK